MESIRVKAKSIVHNNWTLVDKVVAVRVQINNTDIAIHAYMNWIIKEMDGGWWEKDFSLFGVESYR